MNVSWREAPRPGVRYVSGGLILDEELKAGRLVTRYWAPSGPIRPEMHLERQLVRVDEPWDSFVLAVDRQDLAGGYRRLGTALEPNSSGYRAAGEVVHAVLSLSHEQRRIDVKVYTRLDGSQYLIRWLEISNRSEQPVGITAVAPLAGRLWSHRYDEHLPPGATSPFEVAYNHRFLWGQEGDFWFETLPAGVRVVDGGRQGRSGYGRPAFWARDRCTGQTFVCELAWGGNYEFALDCRLDEARKHAELFFRMGLSGHDAVLRVLSPGETVVTPAVHAALFEADLDAVVQATHEHVRRVVLPAPVGSRDIEIEANHRGYLCDRENEAGLKRDAEVAAAVGTELYLIDAGWFGNEPNRWFDNVGDWRAGCWLPNGLEPIGEHVRKLGMRFGLWVEAEAAGANSTLRKEHPDWLLKRDGTPVANGRALDLTQPSVAAWVEAEIERIIWQYDLDLFRIDHNHALSPAGNRLIDGYVEDLTWRYYETFYAIIDRLRARFPRVMFQNCAGGGGRLDWGTLHRFHNTEISDWHRQPRGLKIFNNLTLSLPPEILLRAFGTENAESDLESDLDTQLRVACLARPTLRGVAPSADELTPALRERVEHHLALYRDFIRPLLRGGRMFHHTPCLPLFKPAPWCVLEYADTEGTRGLAALFRLNDMEADEFAFRPRGLDVGRLYDIRLDNEKQSFRVTGRELVEDGVCVRLARPLSSQLLLFAAVGAA